MTTNDISGLCEYSKAIEVLLQEGLIEPAEMIMDLKNLSVPNPNKIFIEIAKTMQGYRYIEDDPYCKNSDQKYFRSMMFILTHSSITQESLRKVLAIECLEKRCSKTKEMLKILVIGGLDLTDTQNIEIIFNSRSLRVLDYIIDNHHVTLEYLNLLIID